MTYEANSLEEHIAQIPEERQQAFKKLQKTISENLPKGFEEGMLYKMIGYYVPLSTYPEGYHCQPNTPLPFINIASQKNSINLYHSGIYAKKGSSILFGNNEISNLEKIILKSNVIIDALFGTGFKGEIQDINKDIIKDASLIFPGQVIKIPELPDEMK